MALTLSETERLDIIRTIQDERLGLSQRLLESTSIWKAIVEKSGNDKINQTLRDEIVGELPHLIGGEGEPKLEKGLDLIQELANRNKIDERELINALEKLEAMCPIIKKFSHKHR